MADFSLKELNIILFEERCSRAIEHSFTSKTALKLYLKKMFTSEDVVCIIQLMMPIVKFNLL